MDGNGRWAQNQGLHRAYGHVQGVESLRRSLRAAKSAGVEFFTVYAFSTENWGRPQEEVDALMELFCERTVSEIPALMEEGVRLCFIGDLESLSDSVRASIRSGEGQTHANSTITLTIAINYSARWEIAAAAKRIAQAVETKSLTAEEITPALFESHLTTASLPDPDLLIRTGGEHRLSNFLLWQLSYSELYFTPIYWPDFDEAAFESALESYRQRKRRYGVLTD